MRAGRLRGLAEVAHECRRQHVLDQRGLARARHAGDGDQALQRELHVHIAQVVLARTLQHQARRGIRHQALEPGADLFVPAEVLAGQRGRAAQFAHRAVEHDLSAALAGPGAEVEDAVGREHHRGVVLHHHQRVARVAQAQHGLGDAVHVARVQADAGLVQHEQRVHQRGAQRRGQVDALHLAARQRAALPVQREVADAHVAQVLEARGDLVMQQLQCLAIASLRVVLACSAYLESATSY